MLMALHYRHGGLFPIVLYPSIIPKDGKDLDAHPNVEAQVTIIKDQGESNLPSQSFIASPLTLS